MKYMKFLLLFLFSCLISAQNIFDYEREIAHKERYRFQELAFENINDGVRLSGTLMTPKKPFDNVVIIILES